MTCSPLAKRNILRRFVSNKTCPLPKQIRSQITEKQDQVKSIFLYSFCFPTRRRFKDYSIQVGCPVFSTTSFFKSRTPSQFVFCLLNSPLRLLTIRQIYVFSPSGRSIQEHNSRKLQLRSGFSQTIHQSCMFPPEQWHC